MSRILSIPAPFRPCRLRSAVGAVALAVVFFGASPVAVHAQPPVQFENTAEAVRKYEAGMLDPLRERCSSVKLDDFC